MPGLNPCDREICGSILRDMRLLIALVACLILLLSGFYAVGQQSPSTTFVPVTDEILQNPAPADWLMWRRTLNSWGYSPLDQITPNNVKQLSLAWVFSTGRGERA